MKLTLFAQLIVLILFLMLSVKDFVGKRLWTTTSYDERFNNHVYHDGLNISTSRAILFGVNALPLNTNRVWIREVILCEESEIVEFEPNVLYNTTYAILLPRRLITREIINEIYWNPHPFICRDHKFKKLYEYANPTLEEVKKGIRENKENILLLPSYSYDLDELYKFAITLYDDAHEYITAPSLEIQKLIDDKNIDSEKLTNMTDDQLRNLYKKHGPLIMYYVNKVPDDIQLGMITTDPALIWLIPNPISEVIAMIKQIPNISSVWSIPKCYYSPVFSFKQEFVNKYKLDYEQFCQQVKSCSGFVSSTCIFAHLIGDTDRHNTDINVVIQGNENTAKFAKYVLKNNYIHNNISLIPDQARNIISTRHIFSSPSSTCNGHITITTTHCHPLALIMNASVLDSYRIAFDGEGVWTSDKFQGQDITTVNISDYTFTLISLTKIYNNCYTKTLTVELKNELDKHCSVQRNKNVSIGNQTVFHAYIKQSGIMYISNFRSEITYTPKIEY